MYFSRTVSQIVILLVLIKFSSEECNMENRGYCTEYGCYAGFLDCYNMNDKPIDDLPFNYQHIYILRIKDTIYSKLRSGYFQDFTEIVNLSMSENVIHIIESGAFNGLSKLKILELYNNNIQSIPIGIFNSLGTVETLDLSWNNISNIESKCFVGMHNLQKLYVNHNSISDLLPLFTGYGHLTHLDISNNLLENFEFPNISLKLLMLNVSRNTLFEEVDMPVNIFRNMMQLEELNMSFTGIKNMHLGTFSPLHKLKTLDLSMNNLKYLPNGIFHDLTQLQELYLNGNQLSYIHYDKLPKLKTISLHDNLWGCDTLLAITKELQNTTIIRGNSYNTINSFGISCTTTIEGNFDIQIKNNSNNQYNDLKPILNQMNHNQERLLSVLERSLLKPMDKNSSNNQYSDLKELLNQTNTNMKKQLSIFEAFSKNNRNNQSSDLKAFINQINLNEEKQLSVFEQSILKIVEELRCERNFSSRNLKDMPKSPEQPTNEGSSNFGNKQTLKNTTDQESTISADIRQILLDFKNFQLQQQQQTFDIKHALATLKNTPQQVSEGDTSMPRIQTASNIGNNGQNNSDTAALYCIFTVLFIGIIILLLGTYKKYRSTRRTHTDCTPLSSVGV